MSNDDPQLPVTSSVEPDRPPEARACYRDALEALLEIQTAFVVGRAFAPIRGTVVGEPEPIFPFLGSSRLERALERHRPALALHGHAHRGTFSAETSSGVRVCNVALHLLRDRGEPHPFTIFRVESAESQGQPKPTP